MKLHTYNAIQLFLTDAQKAKLEKVCLVYQQIYERLFVRVQHAIQAKLEVDYAALIRALQHEDESFGTDVFSKYPKIVKGAELKVRSVFLPVKNFMDCITLAPYLDRELNNGNFVLPIIGNNNGKVEVPHLGELSKEGKTKGALFLEFMRSKHNRRLWHAKAIIETSVNAATDSAGILFMRPLTEAPFGLMSTTNKPVQIVGLREYAKFISDKSKSAGAANKRMNSAHDCADHDFRQGSLDRVDRGFQSERRAIEYAPIFAKQIVETFATLGYCAPASPAHQIDWNFLELNILLAETERLLLLAAVERKQMKSPIQKFFDMAYCIQCGNAHTSKLESRDVICGKRNHDRITIDDAVANNTMRALVAKL